jgi:hypothetical protein
MTASKHGQDGMDGIRSILTLFGSCHQTCERLFPSACLPIVRTSHLFGDAKNAIK